MSAFGKPRQTGDPVRCLNCGVRYRDADIILRHAGRIHAGSGAVDPGDYWNSECPKCGIYNAMSEDYAALTDEEFRAKQHETERQRRESIRRQQRERDRRGLI